jgi:hypothetical protein
MAYLVAKLPLSVLQVYVVALTWAEGFVALTYPVQHALGLNDMSARDANGIVWRGLVVHDVDTVPRELVVSLSGALLLLLAPWAVRAVVLADRLLIRRLLGVNGLTVLASFPGADPARHRFLRDTRTVIRQ